MVTFRARSLAITFGLAGIACAFVALIERHITASNAPGIGIEGAYFNRSVGGGQSVFSYSGDWFVPFKPLNPYLWIGASGALLIVCAAFTWLAIRARREQRPNSGAATA